MKHVVVPELGIFIPVSFFEGVISRALSQLKKCLLTSQTLGKESLKDFLKIWARDLWLTKMLFILVELELYCTNRPTHVRRMALMMVITVVLNTVYRILMNDKTPFKVSAPLSLQLAISQFEDEKGQRGS